MKLSKRSGYSLVFDDGTTWPDPIKGTADMNDKAREMFLWSCWGAYFALVSRTKRRRDEIVAAIRKATKATPKKETPSG